jgi:hypothetical protein
LRGEGCGEQQGTGGVERQAGAAGGKDHVRQPISPARTAGGASRTARGVGGLEEGNLVVAPAASLLPSAERSPPTAQEAAR